VKRRPREKEINDPIWSGECSHKLAFEMQHHLIPGQTTRNNDTRPAQKADLPGKTRARGHTFIRAFWQNSNGTRSFIKIPAILREAMPVGSAPAGEEF
jgi:hypothetical protein